MLQASFRKRMFFFLPLCLIVMKIIHIYAFSIDTEYKNYICNPY